MSVRSGQTVKIIVSENVESGTVDVRSSIVYDAEGNRLTMAQTDPPILRSRANRIMTLTYLAKEGGPMIRYGFPVRIVEFVDDYRLSSGSTGQALVFSVEGEAEPCSLRMHYRVEPFTASGIELFIDSVKVTLLDISVGGARFSHQRTKRLQMGRSCEATIVMGEEAFDVVLRVLRVWTESERNLEFVSVRFDHAERKLTDRLARKIVDIERSLRFREVYG